jgi:hypothetical protein
MARACSPDGILVEGTCDELGRSARGSSGRGCRAALAHAVAASRGLDSPAIAAERLPKALIHRNVPGEPVHAFLAALDAEWVRAVASAPSAPCSAGAPRSTRSRAPAGPCRAAPLAPGRGHRALDAPSHRRDGGPGAREGGAGVGGGHARRRHQVDGERAQRTDEVLVDARRPAASAAGSSREATARTASRAAGS